MVKKFASSASLLQAAAAPMSRVPAATVPVAKGGKMVQVNLKVQAPLADALAEAAKAEGTTQKVIVCRALKAAGFAVDEMDLTNRSTHRRPLGSD